jgi:ketosteroid isomerase-like protein
MTERLLRRYYEEVWVAGRADALEELLAPNYVDHDPPPGFGGGRDDARRFAAAFTAGLHEARFEILALVADQDAAAAHWRMEWTRDGRRVAMRGCDLIRVREGRIAEIFHVERRLTTAS